MARVSGQAFAQSYVELHKVRSMQLGLLNPDEVRKMSVAKIENEHIYDERGLPNFNGINDPRMGTMDKELKCFVCKGTQSDCPGHFGHIELAQAVYHAGLLEYVRKVLRIVCFHCSKILEHEDKKDKIKREEILKVKKQTHRFQRVFKYSDGIRQCCDCGNKQPKFTKSGLKIIAEFQDDNYDQARDKKQVLYPDQALKVLEKISDEDCVLMGFDPKITKPEYMIIRNLAVAPPPVRPSVAMTSSMRSEDDLTYAYQKIIQFNNLLKNQMQKGANQTTINELRLNLQYYVATLMDNEIQGQPTQKHKSGKALKAIRARLRGKEGRLRGNLMGKRVDFSARTVITPDPILQLDQLGVPEQIAMNLTMPETVTAENIDEMRRLVQNGPNTWPGAKYIIRHDDKQIDLSAMRNRSDAHLEPGYKVERHLKHNDYVIFNRQPSLHKMSLMGHRVRVLPFSTFRLNLSVTTPYNADFDGDEMNMHVPQSYETMAEIKEIMAVPKQIVSPQSNKPVMGIVQDSLLGVMLFTLRDTFVELDVVMNLLMWIEYNGTIPQPTIIKPKPLWTGKQLFSLIIPNVNILKVGEKVKDNWSSAGDKNILIQKGELHCGILTKGTIGNSSGGLIHIIWKEYGPDACRDFLSNTQLLINNWLYTNGFTVGVEDIIAKAETIQSIKGKLKQYKRKMQKILQKAQMGKLKSQPGKTMIETFEAEVNQTLNKARDESGNLALDNLTTWNRLKAMVFAGSKGSNLNISQIMACVGQQNVEGKRIPFGFSKRSLPHFSKDDYGPESKGFVENCYLTGLTPSEFFFHAMGGREGLIDTAVKTAETGYIQRRLIKALEDVMAKYDGTVRTSKEQVIQFLYGEDGLAGEHIEDLTIDLLKEDNTKVEAKHMFLPKNLTTREQTELLEKSMERHNIDEVIADPTLTMKLQEEYDQIKKDRDDLRHIILKNCDDAIHIGVNVPRLIWNAKERFDIHQMKKSDLKPVYVLDELSKFFENLSVIPGVKIRNDPLIQEANENSTWLFRIYLRQLLSTKQVIQTERLNQQAFNWLLGEIKTRFEAAIVNPGEMVGSIGAQSMGEPATQMTLNTFHNAGISSKNVTLGVPRLKEIINVAKNIKTPSMKIYLEDPRVKMATAAVENMSDQQLAQALRAVKLKIDDRTLASMSAAEIATAITYAHIKDIVFNVPENEEKVTKLPREILEQRRAMTGMKIDYKIVPLLTPEEIAKAEENAASQRASKFGMKIEHTTLNDLVKNTAIYYDPDPKKTIVQADQGLLDSYFEIAQGGDNHLTKLCPWLLRFELEAEKMHFKNLLMKEIDNKIYENFQDQVNIMYSDDNADQLVIRIRVNDIEDDDEETVCMYLKEFEEKLLHDLTLKGIFEISKVSFAKFMDNEFNSTTGAHKVTKDNYMVETDGVALQKVLGYNKVDFKRTISNDIIEILRVLGIEAVRQSLVNELRFVLGSYGIYVNYRHLATLCDIMTQRGILTSITRHGINRVDTGPLRKCSFEETVEILLEAAVFSEIDHLKGITENIIMGQLAPYGTGCFNLVIDKQVLEEFAQQNNYDQVHQPGETPLYINEDVINGLGRDNNYPSGNYTPIQGMTPAYGNDGGASEYSAMGTPNYQAGFSPGGYFGSPAYMSPGGNQSPLMSPGYQSTAIGNRQSPQYHYQSPIYQAVDYGPSQTMGKATTQQSPLYSPTQRQSPSYGTGDANYSPTYHVGPVQSPVYGLAHGGGNQSSSGYSPSSAHLSSSHHSANYSPTGIQRSPAYSPTQNAYGGNYSPSYSPTSPAYGTGTRYQATSSPRYQTNIGSPTPGGNQYVPTSPAYNPTTFGTETLMGTYQPTPGASYSQVKSEEDDQQQDSNSKKK